MWQLLNLLFLAVVFFVCMTLWMGVWTLILGAVGLYVRKKRVVLLWPLGAAIYVVVVVSCLLHQWSPRTTWQREFGFAAPADVQHLESHTWILGDSGSIRMTFDASPATIARIVQAKSLSTPADNLTSSDRPSGFAPTGTSYAKSGSGDFASEHRQLWFDAATGHAWYEYVGID